MKMVQMVEEGGGEGTGASIICYLKKAGNPTCTHLCQMKSIISKVHAVPSDRNKMKCLYHNKNSQPTLSTTTIISQDCFLLSCKPPGSLRAVSKERLQWSVAVYMFVFCDFFFPFGVLDRVSRCVSDPGQQVLC